MACFCLFPTPVGTCGIAWRDLRVIATNLPEDSALATASRLALRAGATEAEPPPSIEKAIAAISSLLGGKGTDLSCITCDFGDVGDFAHKVYSTTRTIAPGETRTYGDIADQLGDRRLAQRVGQLMGLNPIPIIVPCHRVIGADGKMVGFSAHGGLDTKRRMLAIEGALAAAQQGLFDDLDGA